MSAWLGTAALNLHLASICVLVSIKTVAAIGKRASRTHLTDARQGEAC